MSRIYIYIISYVSKYIMYALGRLYVIKSEHIVIVNLVFIKTYVEKILHIIIYSVIFRITGAKTVQYVINKKNQ